jgi:hypothetical protein
MTTSSVWKFLDRLDEPTRMICRLCHTTLATHNCGNAKKHLRYKHLAEFFEVQATDIQSRSAVYQNKINAAGKIQKKCSNRQSPNRLTIDQITALLMPKVETTDFLPTESPEQTSEEPNDEQHSSDFDPNVAILRKTIKMQVF